MCWFDPLGSLQTRPEVRKPIAQQARGLHAHAWVPAARLSRSRPDTLARHIPRATPGMVVHYKFKSAAQEHRIDFPGPNITVRDLKALIVADAGLRQDRRNLFDLELSHAQSGAIYGEAEARIARNTAVLVRRVPAHHPESIQSVRVFRVNSSSIELEPSSLAIMEKENLEKQKAAAAEQLPPLRRDLMLGHNLRFASLDCPKWLVGRVIGRGGETIREMQSTTGTRIQVDQIVPEGMPCRIGITGPPEQVARGVRMVSAVMADGPPVAARAVPPPSGGGGYASTLLCPLTGQQYVDAVLTSCCGWSFSEQPARRALHATGGCPKCGTAAAQVTLHPNAVLRKAAAGSTAAGAPGTVLEPLAAPGQRIASMAPAPVAGAKRDAVSCDVRSEAGLPFRKKRAAPMENDDIYEMYGVETDAFLP